MTQYREILRLHALGISNMDIAASCQCSRNTVTSVLKRAREIGLSYPEAEGLTDKGLGEKLFPQSESRPAYRMPDYAQVHREMQKSGVTLNLLWIEYCEACRASGELAYKSTQFSKYYNDFLRTTGATMHLNHKPGELMQVDWAGDTAGIVDTDTGEIIPTYLFVASLPYSGYAYVEAFLSMNQEAWINAHVNAFEYFGGVTRIIQCDNLKTGVVKNTRSEVVLNRSYQEMAAHYSLAIIPCRVRSPKDKGHVEGTVGIVSTWIIAALRNRQFLSLRELNEAIRERLRAFNDKPFQRKNGSRALLFEEEKLFLAALPVRRFELSEWKIATVAPNYHIHVEHQNYSVPYEYIRQKVDVRVTRNTVEVLFEGHRICSHPRLYGRLNQYSTQEAHMPLDHQKYVQWNAERFRHWAAKMGENTGAVVEHFLSMYPVEQQGYKACLALLKLADKHSAERLEAACKRALGFTARPSLKSVQAILKSGQDRLSPEPEAAAPDTSSQYGFTRGADYYRRGGEEC